MDPIGDLRCVAGQPVDARAVTPALYNLVGFAPSIAWDIHGTTGTSVDRHRLSPAFSSSSLTASMHTCGLYEEMNVSPSTLA
nr:hypothetical protein CFP56_30204 [Quercus suber]